MLPTVQPLTIGATIIDTVSARDLHAFLEVRRDFTTWIKDRLDTYCFAEHVDFTTYSVFPENGEKGGRPRTEYAITLDTAKHLAMMERNAKGHEARRYFIECERRVRSATVADLPPLPQTFAEALQLAADKQREVDRQAAEIAVLAPRSEALATIADASGTYSVTEAAKSLQMPPGGLWDYLFREQWTYRRERDGTATAYQSKIAAGYLTHKVVPIPTGDGRTWAKQQVRVTAKGLTALAQRIQLDRPPGLLALPSPSTAPARA